MHSHKKTQVILHVRFVWDISISGVGIGLHRFFPKTLNSIKLCWNESKKMQRLNNDERNQVIGILIAGMSAVTVVSWHFGCTRKTIERLRRQFLVTGNVQPICVYRPYFGQILTRLHWTTRRDWCRRHLHFRRADWDFTLFTDECQFNLGNADRRKRVYPHQGKHFANTACVIELDRFGGVSVLVWGGLMGGNKTRLIFINGNINAEALPFIQFHGPNTFMHNNAHPHSAAITRQFLLT